jgi:hypothetical protein
MAGSVQSGVIRANKMGFFSKRDTAFSLKKRIQKNRKIFDTGSLDILTFGSWVSDLVV